MLKLMFQWQNQVEEVDRLKGKVKVKKEVNVNLKNRAERGRSGNRIMQVRLNIRARSEEGTRKQY